MPNHWLKSNKNANLRPPNPKEISPPPARPADLNVACLPEAEEEPTVKPVVTKERESTDPATTTTIPSMSEILVSEPPK